MFRRLSLALLIAALAAMPVATVLATPPQHNEWEVTITDEVVESCDGFDIVMNGTVRIRETVFFDSSGEPLRLQIHVRLKSTVANSATSLTVVDNAALNLIFDLVEGGHTAHGLNFSYNIPGEGIVVLDAGTIIVAPDGNVTLKGPHQVFGQGLEVLCEALA